MRTGEVLVHPIRAITFDFFQTLARHRRGDGGRGRSIVEYLASLGMRPSAWEHRMLYDVFAPFPGEYSAAVTAAAKQECFVELTRRLLDHLDLPSGRDFAAVHATPVWQLIGPASLELYPEVHAVLTTLRRAGYRLAVISNWHCGLGHFCAELGISGYFDHIVVSAEVGHSKPSRLIFEEATRRLGVASNAILHIGDSITDDVEGARAAGLHAILLDRSMTDAADGRCVMHTLSEIARILDGRERG